MQTKRDWGNAASIVPVRGTGHGARIPANASTRVSVDFVLPYGPAEIRYLPDALRSIGWQQAADIHLHLIPDGGAEGVPVSLPPHVTVHWYDRTDGRTDRLGPYRIANAVAAKHTRTPWLFICDADDISLPTRAWESVATAERHRADMVGGEMIQWLDGSGDQLSRTLAAIPRWASGSVYDAAPLGALTNPTRCVSVAAFRRINGFEDWSCAADFEFDTRAKLRGLKVYAASTVWGLRRLRDGAVTNAPETGMGSPSRNALLEEIVRRSKLTDLSSFGAMDRDAGLLREVGQNRVGFVTNSFVALGGVAVWHRSLVNRLGNVEGLVGFDANMSNGDFSKLDCPTSVGVEAARDLARRCDVLVVWGLGERLGDVLRPLATEERPRIISVSHADKSSSWTLATMRAQAKWTDQSVYLCPSGIETCEEHQRERAILIPNAPDPLRVEAIRDRSTIRHELGVADDEVLLLVLSRVSPEKRIERIVEAVDRLPENYRLVIAGSDNRHGRIYASGLRAKMGRRCKIIEPVDLPGELLAAADMYLSASEQEGYGLSTAEAMLAGVPVVATPTGFLESDPGLARIVAHDAGPEAWAAAIVDAVSQPQQMRKRAETAKLAMRTQHSINGFVDSWRRLLDGPIDLSDVTFLIPARVDTPDRLENIELTIRFLRHHFKTNILLVEDDADPKLSHLAGQCDLYTFVRSTLPTIHRTHATNVAARNVRTPYLALYDADVLLPISQYIEAVRRLRDDEADLVYPYEADFVHMPREQFFADVRARLSVEHVDPAPLKVWSPSVGGAMIYRTSAFFASGCENERIRYWGYEDNERHARAKGMGLRVSRVPGVIYHMDHDKLEDGKPWHVEYEANRVEFERIAAMAPADLRTHIAEWPWVEANSK